MSEDITQEYLRWIDSMKRITDREIELNDALRRSNPPTATNCPQLTSNAIRSQKDAGCSEESR